MKVSELGEFGLIQRLAEVLAGRGTAGAALAVGIGDDAAVWRSDASALLVTTDTLVAGVHFLPDGMPWRDLGWKLLGVNVSDIAAMGGTPQFAVITLAVPADTDVEGLEELYAGLAEAGAAYRVAVAGGDVVRSPTLLLSATLVGRAELDAAGEPSVLRRDGAEAGDLIAVTGALGGSAGGLAALRDERQDSDEARRLIERHRRPPNRVDAGLAARAAGIRCAIDVSDGLLQDLGHVCRASAVGAVVRRETVPIEPGLDRLVAADVAVGYAIAGGEDYELLLIGGRNRIDAVRREIETPLTVIGEIVAAPKHEVTLLDASGNKIDVPSGGWDHLRGER